MKRRNLLLAFALIAGFLALGVIYFRTYVVPKPFGVILFVGEGLTSAKLTAARFYDGGADPALTIQKLPNLALLSTHANDLAVPDAAAAASALATGQKVNQRALAIDPVGRPLRTLLEIARDRRRATGLITNGCLTDPTPAAFYAHSTDFRGKENLAAQLIDNAAPDVVLGGGGGDFLPDLKGGRRKDSRDLVLDATQKMGYGPLVRTAAELEAVSAFNPPRVLGLFAPDAFAFRDEAAAANQLPQPSLADLVRRAIALLQQKRGGYFLVVDAGLIGRASERDQGEHALQELVELDRAVGVALQYAGPQSVVLVAGTVSTGGMALNGYPLRQDRGVALLGTNVYGLPSLTWSTGPNGGARSAATTTAITRTEDTADVAAAASPSPNDAAGDDAARQRAASEPAAFPTPVAANVADSVIAAGFGPGTVRLRGWQDNTLVWQILKDQL
ncbi:MAG: alkaline phosphatase [Verrucomicrobia bacterium]|nr:alkaline phosphatase [Verrucomicrobiota bacterium]